MPHGGFGGRGGGFGMRRGGFPLVMGGGMGMGSPLLTTMMAGGLGYMLGSNRNQDQQQQPAPAPVVQPTPGYPQQSSPSAPESGADGGRLAQLQLLGQLHDSGTLTDAEFATEKQHILGRT